MNPGDRHRGGSGGPAPGPPSGPPEIHLRELPPGTAPLPLLPELDVFRPPAEQAQALADIAGDPAGLVITAERGDRTVGYVSFHPPGRYESWSADPTRRLIELGAIEVAPSLRGERLGERLLAAAFDGGRYDDTVVFATLYVWHYDLARTGLTPFAYKRLLERLYRKGGLIRMATSDAEIRADAANALVARIGTRAPQAVVDAFERLRTAPPRGPAGLR